MNYILIGYVIIVGIKLLYSSLRTIINILYEAWKEKREN